MANKSSQSADWERTNTRAENAWRKQRAANPSSKSWVTTNAKLNTGYYDTPKGVIESKEAARTKMNESRSKIASLRMDAKKAALKKLGK